MHGPFVNPTIGRMERGRLPRARKARRGWPHHQGARGASPCMWPLGLWASLRPNTNR